jgi:transposase-like protein
VAPFPTRNDSALLALVSHTRLRYRDLEEIMLEPGLRLDHTTRDGEAAKRFFLKTLTASHTSEPRVINVDKNAAYPKAFAELKAAGKIPEKGELRQGMPVD